MGHADYFKSGDFNVICDTCGQKFKASKVKKQWDGFITCNQCWDYRHPQEFVRAKEDKQATPYSRPDASPTFVDKAASLPLPNEN